MAEAALVDLTDEQLKELLGYSWEAIKRLEEAKKNDAYLIEMKTKTDEYTEENYTRFIKANRARLKAARAQAHVRGIKWKAPDNI
jgi:hypothetical protein